MHITCHVTQLVTEVSTELNLKQIIKTSTRITDTSQSLIDVIVVSSTAHELENGILDTIISDHLPVYALIKLRASKMPLRYITARSNKNYNLSLFCFDLATKSDRLLSIFSNTDIKKKLGTFNDILHSTLDVYAPVRTCKVRGRPCPYISNEIKELMKSRNLLHCRNRQTHYKRDWENIKEARNRLKTKIKNESRNHNFNEVK